MRYATVDEVIEILKEASEAGYGSYMVTCNQEYALAKPGDSMIINDRLQVADLGGYD